MQGAGISFLAPVLPAFCSIKDLPCSAAFSFGPQVMEPLMHKLRFFDGGHTLADQIGLMWLVQCEIFEQVANI